MAGDLATTGLGGSRLGADGGGQVRDTPTRYRDRGPGFRPPLSWGADYLTCLERWVGRWTLEDHITLDAAVARAHGWED